MDGVVGGVSVEEKAGEEGGYESVSEDMWREVRDERRSERVRAEGELTSTSCYWIKRTRKKWW